MHTGEIKIVIADDHPVVLSGLFTLLTPYRHIKILKTFHLARPLIEELGMIRPDVLLLDLILPDLAGKELATTILEKYPWIRILVLTSLDVPHVINSIIRKGVKGYVLKGINTKVLVEAIETVNRGEEFIEPDLKKVILGGATVYKTKPGSHIALSSLSQREKEVLKLIAEEYTTKEIAEKLFISYKTAENHRYNLLQKLDVKNTAGLIKIALQLNSLDG